MNGNQFGNQFGNSNGFGGGGFGQPFGVTTPAPQAPAQAQPAHQPQAPQGAASTPTAGRRRMQVDDAVPTGPTRGVTLETPPKVPITGLQYCYLKAMNSGNRAAGGKVGANFTVAIWGGPADGAECSVFQEPGNAAWKLAKFYEQSGYPESRWQVDNEGRRIQPVPQMFFRKVDGVLVPIMMIGEFSTRAKDGSASEFYQDCNYLRPVLAFKSPIIAPCPRFMIFDVAEAWGLKGELASNGSMKVETSRMQSIHPIFSPAEYYTRLDGGAPGVQITPVQPQENLDGYFTEQGFND
jgi:hypothetical protein